MQLIMLYFSNRDPDGLGRKLIVKSQHIYVILRCVLVTSGSNKHKVCVLFYRSVEASRFYIIGKRVFKTIEIG